MGEKQKRQRRLYSLYAVVGVKADGRRVFTRISPISLPKRKAEQVWKEQLALPQRFPEHYPRERVLRVVHKGGQEVHVVSRQALKPKPEWVDVRKQQPPPEVEVETCVIGGAGVTNIRRLHRRGRLWFSGKSYMYYRPTHWRYVGEKVPVQSILRRAW